MTRISAALFVFDEAIDPARLRASLRPAERDRHAATTHARRQREYLASRWLLRQHLAAEFDTPPQALAIDYPAGAAPRCVDTTWHLGLSHSGPACLSVVAEAPVGCDIEQHRARRFAPEQLAEHCFHTDEAAALRAAAPANRLADFHRLWALKEAALKARGLGLGSGMKQPCFALRPRLRCTGAAADDGWLFAARDLELAAGRFALAIVTAASDVDISLCCLQPTGTHAARRTALAGHWQIAAHGDPTDDAGRRR